MASSEERSSGGHAQKQPSPSLSPPLLSASPSPAPPWGITQLVVEPGALVVVVDPFGPGLVVAEVGAGGVELELQATAPSDIPKTPMAIAIGRQTPVRRSRDARILDPFIVIVRPKPRGRDNLLLFSVNHEELAKLLLPDLEVLKRQPSLGQILVDLGQLQEDLLLIDRSARWDVLLGLLVLSLLAALLLELRSRALLLLSLDLSKGGSRLRHHRLLSVRPALLSGGSDVVCFLWSLTGP